MTKCETVRSEFKVLWKFQKESHLVRTAKKTS